MPCLLQFLCCGQKVPAGTRERQEHHTDVEARHCESPAVDGQADSFQLQQNKWENRLKPGNWLSVLLAHWESDHVASLHQSTGDINQQHSKGMCICADVLQIFDTFILCAQFLCPLLHCAGTQNFALLSAMMTQKNVNNDPHSNDSGATPLLTLREQKAMTASCHHDAQHMRQRMVVKQAATEGAPVGRNLVSWKFGVTPAEFLKWHCHRVWSNLSATGTRQSLARWATFAPCRFAPTRHGLPVVHHSTPTASTPPLPLVTFSM